MLFESKERKKSYAHVDQFEYEIIVQTLPRKDAEDAAARVCIGAKTLGAFGKTK